MKKIFILLCLLALPAFGSLPPEVSGKILYLIHKHETEKALSCYLEEAKEPDFGLLQQIGSRIIEEGAKSEDPETLMMTLFGAGIATSPDLLPALRKGVQSGEIKHQLAALNFLGKLHDDEADQLIQQALSSPFLLTRLEAAYLLAEKSDGAVIDHLRSLIGKVPKEVKPLFAQIVSRVDTPEATHFFRELLADSDERVRVEAIFEATKAKRDDLLPQIRALATHPDRAQQEAALVALGRFKDESSIPLLRKAANGPNQLAAWYALYQLGETDILPKIEKKAREEDLFAISLLREMEEGKELLVDLIKSQDPNVCLNTIIALLQQKDPRVTHCLKEILIHDKRDLGFAQHFSPGKGFVTWKVVPMATPRAKTFPALSMHTHQLKEKVLLASLELPEERFLAIAKMVFDHQQSELVPLLVELLGNLRSKEAIALLKENQQKAGAPLIRNYCNLALLHLGEKGPYEENLIRWARGEQGNELIRFKEEKASESKLHYALTPEETSQLLIQVFETLASTRSEAGINALLHAIAYGNPKNKYALAGLLIRTAE